LIPKSIEHDDTFDKEKTMPTFEFDGMGTFIKTDSPQVVEVLGTCALDFAVVDAEHAPFDLVTIDRMMLASRAAALPLLVRVPDHRDETILRVLDMGAAGVVVPRVDTPEDARAVVAAARYVGGRRGISPSPRNGGYGSIPLAEMIAASDRSAVVCQIESGAAVASVDEIAAVPGVAGLLVGRLDLSLSLGVSGVRHPQVMAGVERTVAAARRAGIVAAVACGPAEIAEMAAMGVTCFVVGSDQSLLASAASTLRGRLAAP
jgi:2-keto-3-deoxy-L-rhamnonate aldolase RhmA